MANEMQLAATTMMLQGIEFKHTRFEIWIKMQAGFKNRVRFAKPAHARHAAARNLMELRRGEPGVLEHIDLPEEEARRLMEMGFLPGHTVTPAHSAPGGDPRVFRVDGSEIALRRETARRLILRQGTS